MCTRFLFVTLRARPKKFKLCHLALPLSSASPCTLPNEKQPTKKNITLRLPNGELTYFSVNKLKYSFSYLVQVKITRSLTRIGNITVNIKTFLQRNKHNSDVTFVMCTKLSSH